MSKSTDGGHSKPRKGPEPRVGIFWLVAGTPLIESTSLRYAESYGDHLTYPRGHTEVWEHYKRAEVVPGDMEYEESPRGRVAYSAKTQRFTFLADRCILRDKCMVCAIMSEMNLPRKRTDTGADSHYRCFGCLRVGTH